MRHQCKSRRKHQREIIVTFVGKLNIFRWIAQNTRLGLKRNGFLTIQIISPNEKFVFMKNRVIALVEAVETYCLILDTKHHLELLETLYAPRLSMNLVLLSKLNVIGYSFNFGNECFNLFKHNDLIGTSILCHGLYKLNLNGFIC